MNMHVVKISDALYQRMSELAEKRKFSGAGAALEYYLETLEAIAQAPGEEV